MRRTTNWALWAFMLATPLGVGGCTGIFSMRLFTPLPVPPWVTERMQERYCWKNDFRPPVLPPTPEGKEVHCEAQPDDARVIRAMPRVTRGVPYFYEEFRE